MSGKCYIARSSQTAARLLGDEMVIMSAGDSRVFSLNQVATVIWEAADGRTPLDEIIADRVCAKFEVAPQIALKDAEELVQELASQGILLVSDQPIVRLDSSPRETS
ncbi:MAG TPA: PqqD family protein [Candidatus Acidoferrum sp.]|nr:PqqD family protein [Candidatus Acidoferrum sp.]